VYKLLSKASHNRSVAETKCNERSSRSHSVFRLHLTGRNSLTEETCTGQLYTMNSGIVIGVTHAWESGTRNLHKFLASELCNLIDRLCFELLKVSGTRNLHRIECNLLESKFLLPDS